MALASFWWKTDASHTQIWQKADCGEARYSGRRSHTESVEITRTTPVACIPLNSTKSRKDGSSLHSAARRGGRLGRDDGDKTQAPHEDSRNSRHPSGTATCSTVHELNKTTTSSTSSSTVRNRMRSAVKSDWDRHRNGRRTPPVSACRNGGTQRSS